MGRLPSSLTWPDVTRLVETLAGGLRDACGEGAFDRVIGVARGGLVPAALLATALGIERVETIQVRLYEGTRRRDGPQIVGAVPTGDGRTLLVDEILDSGATLRFLEGLLPDATQAVLVARDLDGQMVPDRGLWRPEASAPGHAGPWAAEIQRDERWVMFPWSPPEDRGGAQA